MRARSGSPEIEQWWQVCDRFAVSRTRRFAVEADAMARLEAEARANA